MIGQNFPKRFNKIASFGLLATGIGHQNLLWKMVNYFCLSQGKCFMCKLNVSVWDTMIQILLYCLSKTLGYSTTANYYKKIRYELKLTFLG